MRCVLFMKHFLPRGGRRILCTVLLVMFVAGTCTTTPAPAFTLTIAVGSIEDGSVLGTNAVEEAEEEGIRIVLTGAAMGCMMKLEEEGAAWTF